MSERQVKEERLQFLEKKRRLLEQKLELKRCLRHLYGMPWYGWAWNFFTSVNRMNLLVAANQISKSSTQIRKCINWATDIDLWPQLWPSKPTQFWYFYVDFQSATVEFREKWVKEWLPLGPQDVGRNPVEIAKDGAWLDHPIYGWKPVWHNKEIRAVVFNSGVTVYFKSYEQGANALQTASVYACFCDEELPEQLYYEILARGFAPNIGIYFHHVFTATLGQEFWRSALEEKGRNERFPDAYKQQVSMYQCLTYKDGSKSPWTTEKIEEIKRLCRDDAEINRRVYGRFVVDKDRKYPSFVRTKNVKVAHKLPKEWLIYAGVDVGSGGEAHPAAICFVGVKPDFTVGRVFKGWRGDGIITDASDILNRFLELRGGMKPVGQFYDHQSKDFFTVASRRGIPFQKADKARDSGQQLLNTLFKNDMLVIYDEPELMKLVNELESLKASTHKSSARDDFIDALRFAVTQIPWDFAKLNTPVMKKKDPHAHLTEREKLRRGLLKAKTDGLDLIEAEMDLANEAYEYGLEEGDGEYDW